MHVVVFVVVVVVVLCVCDCCIAPNSDIIINVMNGVTLLKKIS